MEQHPGQRAPDEKWDTTSGNPGPAQPGLNPLGERQSPRLRWIRVLALVTIIGGILAGAVLYGTGRLGIPAVTEADGADSTTEEPPPPEESESATAAPMTPPVQPVDLDTPFVRTAAANWAEGEAGVVAAEATPIGDHPAATVQEAVDAARAAVIAARLDPRSLVEHDPEGLLGLLAPDLQTGLRETFAEDDVEAGLWITRVDDSGPLLPVPPRVSGQMTVDLDADGEILVRTDYLFAYAFEPPEEVADDPGLTNSDLVVFTRVEQDFSYVTGQEWADSSQGLWSEELVTFSYGMACDTADEGFLAPGFTETPSSPLTSPGDVDIQGMFDADRPMPTEGNC
ncbi:hypothetical protein [Actinoalloteichus hymeniacidonis]|uniref:Uncharacterized protein n=1 Tax=Actinoalloteichus hymeniacidonis TaxID=340345 RepID=A0AAC9HN92_9PSEU|nr:hypothetical protein [Actinoalloteichus hymeniacidonis]AOS62434.1 hypothetical protein TL08_08095 [Actinoalloteichus hymeniacidonis]MBB5909535.1 hypothetical protein [Actinoalloteichus hymeniacidonis]